MPPKKNLGCFILYVGIGLSLVCLVVIGAFYAPAALKSASHWLVFAAVSGFVFGYPIYDFWRFRAKERFWLALLLLFAFHTAFWVFYVHPHFDGDPRLGVGFLMTFLEFGFVSLTMKSVLPAN